RLIPTTLGALLAAIGIAGMDRMIQKNVIAMSGRAVEAAGDVDVLLLDKTGTITLGNRQATQFVPAPGVAERDLADAAQLASLADETPEGRSIVVLAKEKYGIRERDVEKLGATFVAFTAQTRMSGVNMNGRQVRKGAADAIEAYVQHLGGTVPTEVRTAVDSIAKAGATPLVVADGARVLGWGGSSRPRLTRRRTTRSASSGQRRVVAVLPQHGEVRSGGGVRLLPRAGRRGAHAQGRQVGDADRLRGLRQPEEPELLALLPLHARHAVPPHGAARDLPGHGMVQRDGGRSPSTSTSRERRTIRCW